MNFHSSNIDEYQLIKCKLLKVNVASRILSFDLPTNGNIYVFIRSSIERK